MQSRDEIFKWVSDVLQREFEFRQEELRLESRLVEDLDLDSIDAIDLAVRMEEQLGVKVAERDLKTLRTLEDVVSLVHDRLG